MNERHAMMVRADAKAVGIVTAIRVGGGNKQPRTYTRASECISYKLDDKSDAVIFRSARTERRATRRTTATIAPKRIMSSDLRPLFAD